MESKTEREINPKNNVDRFKKLVSDYDRNKKREQERLRKRERERLRKRERESKSEM